MQVVHATFAPGEGEQAVSLLDTLGIDVEDYKLIKSESGDLLIISLLYGNVDGLIDNLTSYFDFNTNRERSLIIFTPDTVIPEKPEKARIEAFHTARAALITFARKNSTINPEYLIMVIASAIITTLGLILDNVAVVVGGMVIAPVLGPILAITIGIVLGKARLIRQGISAEIIAVLLAIFTGFIFGLLIPGIEINNSLRIRMFPTFADLLIAIAAGAAAAFSLMQGKLSTGLVGVMVAASLLPVMCTIGIGISLAYQTLILGALILLTGNYLGLLLANVIVFYFEGLRPQIWHQQQAEHIIKKSLVLLLLAVLVLSLPLGIITVYQFYVEKPPEIIETTIRENLRQIADYHLEKVEIKGRLIEIYVYTEGEIDHQQLLQAKNSIETRLAGEYNLKFRFIPVREVDL